MAHQNLKLVAGMEVTVIVTAITPAPSTVNDRGDYKVEGMFTDGDTVSFFIGGQAAERQVTDHLGLSDIQDIVGVAMTFKRKAGKRGNGAATVFLDIDYAPEEFTTGVTMFDGSAAPAPVAAAAPRPAAVKGRPVPAKAAAPTAPAPETLTETGPEVMARVGRMYATAFATARGIAEKHDDLNFMASDLHAMAATIMIEVSKILRKDRF